MNKELEEKYGIDFNFEPREMYVFDDDINVKELAYVFNFDAKIEFGFSAVTSSGGLDRYKHVEELPDYEPPLKMGDKIEAGSGFNETIFIKHGSDDSVIAIASKDISKYENGQAFNTVCTCYWRRIKPIKITLNVNGEDKELSELTEKEKEYIKNNL